MVSRQPGGVRRGRTGCAKCRGPFSLSSPLTSGAASPALRLVPRWKCSDQGSGRTARHQRPLRAALRSGSIDRGTARHQRPLRAALRSGSIDRGLNESARSSRANATLTLCPVRPWAGLRPWPSLGRWEFPGCRHGPRIDGRQALAPGSSSERWCAVAPSSDCRDRGRPPADVQRGAWHAQSRSRTTRYEPCPAPIRPVAARPGACSSSARWRSPCASWSG